MHLPADSVDRVFCKNVLEYVPDALTTLKQHHEVLVSGGMIQVLDRVGTLRGVLTNMASYIDTLNSMDKTVVDALMAELDEAMSVGNYLVVLPQFIVTARK
ncbi:MAG: hypothetical protein DRQ65_04605 [Gammaproteobacteria bacterium]|nr:MAG: hypothetical protein DRQ65_04605 [Gammaproteobacteria bacterium]